MKRKIEFTIPNVNWKQIFCSIRFVSLILFVFAGFCTYYWWKNIHPYYTIENGVLHIASSEIRSEEAGSLSECPFEEGDCFKQGQMLFSFDVAKEWEKLQKIDQKIETVSEQLLLEKQNAEQGMEQYVYLQKELNLEGKSSELLDQIIQEVQKLEESSQQLAEVVNELRTDRSELAQIIGKKTVISHFEGAILRSFKSTGDFVQSNEPILIVSNYQKRWVEVDIPETELPSILVGSNAVIQFPSFPHKKWNGHVSWISPTAKDGKLKIRLTSENLPTRSGLTAKVSLKTR